MRIKVIKTIQVGGSTNVVPAGDVVDVDDAEGKALVVAGLAVETTADKKKKDDNKITKLLDGSVDDVVAGLEGLTAAELVQLRDSEAAGKNRKGIADAIAEFDLDA